MWTQKLLQISANYSIGADHGCQSIDYNFIDSVCFETFFPGSSGLIFSIIDGKIVYTNYINYIKYKKMQTRLEILYKIFIELIFNKL